MGKEIKKLELLFRTWTVTNGIDGETCTDFQTNDTELWCKNAVIPKCVDRTIICVEPPMPAGAQVTFLQKPSRLPRPKINFNSN